MLHDISWEQFEAFLKMRGDGPATRVAYCEGALESMAPSVHHERRKKNFAALLEAWLVENEIPFAGAGSWTMRSQAAARGVEPDDCFILGRRSTTRSPSRISRSRSSGRPAGWTSWTSTEGSASVKCGDGGAGSELLPALDLDLLCRYVDYPDQG